jgi:hypothetical protein
MSLFPKHATRFLVPTLLLASVLASGPAAAQAAPAAAPAPTPKAKKLPPIFDTWALGTKAIEAGVKVCNETNRRPFVVFGVNDCDACRVFNDALHDEVFFKAFAAQFVPILIDVTPGGPNVELLKRYGIDPAKGFPAVGIFELGEVPPEVTRNGELIAVCKKGKQAVQEWILARYHQERPDLDLKK